jgi:hypothetical protein
MTSLAFILGVVPLAVSTGAGAGARHAVGTGVMGGMLAATFLAIFFIPLFFRVMTDGKFRERRSTHELRTEIEHHKALAAQRTAVPRSTDLGGAEPAPGGSHA